MVNSEELIGTAEYSTL